MALDASTSKIGVTIMGIDGELLLLTHFEPKKDKELKEENGLFDKCTNFLAFLDTLGLDKTLLSHVVIEKALISSTNTFTATLLSFYQGMLYGMLQQKYPDIQVFLMTVDECRRTALPEISKKGVLWSAVPSKVGTRKKDSDLKKLVVMVAIALRYPEIKWAINRNKALADSNFDKADSVVVALAFLIANKYILQDEINIQNVLSICEKYIEYNDWSKTTSGTSTEKNAMKKYYLEEVYQLDKVLNFEVYV